VSPAPRPGGLAAFLIGAWLAVSLLTPLASALGEEGARLRHLVNEVRRDHHLIPLRESEELARVAHAHAEDMVRRRYFAHVNPDGANPLDRVRAAGVSGFRMLAENLGTSNESGDRLRAIVRAWLDSPVHRENLLNPAFNTSGLAIARTHDDLTIVVQLYATY
jgi:uncharacterized protein YkwD